MKRDYDLIRGILLQLEELPPANSRPNDVSFDGVSTAVINDHLVTMDELKLIDCRITKTELGAVDRVHVFRITSLGQDFLALARNLEVWSAAKKEAGWLSYDLFFAALHDSAKNHGKSWLDVSFPSGEGT